MARRKNPDAARSRRKPATTPEERENQLVSLAADLAEEQITNGTASSQVITHFLKLGSTRERLEQQRIHYENEMLVAKREQMESAARVEEMYTEALTAMRTYSGQVPDVEHYDED